MAMSNMGANRVSDEIARALSLMEQALALLDSAEIAPEAGADLDHAICRLRNLLDGAGRGDSRFPIPDR